MATFTTQREWQAVLTTYPDLPLGVWLGGYQPEGTAEPFGGWSWVTGESWDFTFWLPQAPNEHPIGSDYLQVWVSPENPDRRWNDLVNDAEGRIVPGYLLEYGYPSDPHDFDSDDDGVDDGLEREYGTNPLSAGSYPEMLQIERIDPSSFRLRLLGQSQGTWQLEGSSDLRSWQKIPAVMEPDGELDFRFTISPQFFRVKALDH